MKIIFAGTPKFAADALSSLIHSPYNIIAVYTQPDRPAGRGRKTQKSEVKLLAEENNLNIFQPETLKTVVEQEKLAALKPDLIIVVAYGLILPQAILDIPTLGCINVHASLLPAWRGASPVQQAILHGDSITGITIMQMDQSLDTGDILSVRKCSITDLDTSESLLNKLSIISQQLLVNTISKIENNAILPIKQDNNYASYAPKILKTDALINWQDDATIIHRKIRAFYPWPIAYSSLNDLNIKFITAEILPMQNNITNIMPGRILNISKLGLDIVCGNKTVIRITKLQLPNKNPITIKDLLNSKSNLLMPGNLFNNP
jgi:methionyl-tRNA formyltransferase